MNEACRRFDGLIARSAQLTTDEAAELEAHLAGCDSCRELARMVKPVSNEFAFAATGASDTMADDARGNVAGDERALAEGGTDRYRITGEVGRGGIGRVLQALDRVLDRPVALKELFSATDGTRRRFIREALITARLQHPSIVPVYDAGSLGDRSPFYAMKLVAGRPLDQAIADAKTLAQRLALLPIVLAVADAMAYAHNERVIHRDLKPTNILVGKYGETIVIDWGLAKDLAHDDHDALDAGPYRAAGLDHTMAGAVLGTPAYMAPEQAAGQPVDERADVYALGAILYHAVSGAIPHEGTTLEEMVGRVIRGDVRPLAERVPEVPRDLAAIVTRAMAVDPSERYANAQGFAEDVRRYLTGQLVASHTYGTRELLRRWLKRHRAAVTVAAAAFAVVAVLGTLSVQRIMRAQHEAEQAASRAQEEMVHAQQRLADEMTERGRQELLAGRPARAAIYLSEAQAQSHDPSAALRSLLADAMRPLDAQRLSLDDRMADLSPDGTRIAVAGSLGSVVKVLDVATGAVVATMTGHGRFITSVMFSPDGARIVTAGADKTVRVWDARTGKPLATLEHAEMAFVAKFSPDGSLIATVSGANLHLAIEVWDASSGTLVSSLAGAGSRSLSFSEDGMRVAVPYDDHSTKIWDVKTGKLLAVIVGDANRAVFSPDGSQLVTVNTDHTARVWDARTGKLLVSLDGHAAAVVSAAYSSDGERVVTASNDRTAKIWDARSGKLLTSLDGHAGEVESAAFSSDGTRVVTASTDHTARVWDARTGRLLATFEGHRDVVMRATFSHDGSLVLTESPDRQVKLWNATSSKLRISFGDGVNGTPAGAISRDGASIVTTASHTARVWDAHSGKLIASLGGHHDNILSAAFDHAGLRVVTASADHTAKIWDAKTGALLRSLDHPDAVRTAVFSPDGTRVVTTPRSTKRGRASPDAAVRLWNASTGELIATLRSPRGSDDDDDPDEEDVFSAAFSTDGTRVVTATADGGRIWNADDGKLIATLEDRGDEELTAELSHDGEHVVTASLRSAKVWDARTGKLVASLDGHTEDVRAASFSPDGTRVVTASDDHTAKLWDAQTGKLLASFDGHTDQVFDAVFSPDGARVVTASRDHTAKIWDAQTGKLLSSLEGSTSPIGEVAFTSDGASIAAMSTDGRINVWDAHLETRDHDAIRHVVGDRDPWMLANEGLVPVRDQDAVPDPEPAP